MSKVMVTFTDSKDEAVVEEASSRHMMRSHGTRSMDLDERGATSIDRSVLFMQFKDPEIEAEYADSLDARNRRSLLIVLSLPLPVAIAEGAYLVAVFGFGHVATDTCLAMRATFIAMTLASIVVLARWKRVSTEVIALVWATLASVLVMLFSVLRMGKILDCFEEVLGWFTADDGQVTHNDMGTILSFQTICYATLVFVQVRSCVSWLLPLAQLVIFSACMLGGFNALSLFSNCINIALITVLTSLVWSGCYKAERITRERWSEGRALRREIAKERTMHEMHKRLLEEVNERLEALQAVNVESSATVAPISTTKGLEETKGQVPSPGRLVPVRTAGREPNLLLTSVLSQTSCNSARLHSMAKRIREVDYGMEAFFEDALATFPELSIFHSSSSDANCGSGRSVEDEYQRTIGALFAVYWLLRLDIDGKDGWCFGVGENWQVAGAAGHASAKRAAFLQDADWDGIAELVSSAICSSQERVEAMLCLTAFHDIMKVPGLCPIVCREHAPYRGYTAGTVIHDHDLALAYVLEHFPELLPSYRILPAEMQRVVLFTQGKMEFNHGWFVQAEAPPGPMLRQLRSVLADARSADLAFYFLHWLTDLSGAEGRPLAGAEKFVLKFPIRVLGEFMWSIPFLQKLLDQNEVAVFEDYLRAKWARSFPELEVPSGDTAVALLRLAVMAQGNARLVVERFGYLDPACKDVLSSELSRTGLDGQYYKGCWPNAPGGPALLVYYGPALLQRCKNKDEIDTAIMYIAGVLSAGRALWPLSCQDEDRTVKLEIGKLVNAGKEPQADDAVWVLLPRNKLEARVEALQPSEVNHMNAVGDTYWIIDKHCDVSRLIHDRSEWSV